MEELEKYTDALKQLGEKKLQEYFDVSVLKLNDFNLVNSFLIYQSVTKSKNLLIYLPNKQTKSQFYIPVILTLSLYEFINNYIDNDTVFEVGDILQRDKKRYRITLINQDQVELKSRDKNNTVINTSIKNLKKNYIVTNTTNLTPKRVKVSFYVYKDFFTKTLKLNDTQGLPSKFKYKSIIITEKKIVDELKKYKINNTKVHKAFPFRYIASTGSVTDNLPIDPMIYIVNSYETARKHILEQGINIENVIFIGANKYQDYILNVSSDIANNKFKNVIFIGSADIPSNAIPNLLKWKWTLTELIHYKYFKPKPIKIEIVSDESFERKVKEFDNLIKSIESKYKMKLTQIYSYVKKLFPITIPNENSRLIKQLDYLLDSFDNEGKEFIEDEFFEIEEYDYEETWKKIYDKFKLLVDYKRTDLKKFERLKNLKKISYLVVPKEYIGIWREETNIKNIISFNEFKELKKRYNQKKFGKPNVVFLGFYGCEHLKEIIYSDFDITLVLYSMEKKLYNYCNDKFLKDTIKNISDKDRKTLTGLSIEQTQSEETVSELLERLFLKNAKKEYKEYDYSNVADSSLNYELEFENRETIILEENKTVLLQTKKGERPEKVKNIKEGDKIRVYENTSKEKLYKIALEADKEGRFTEIENASKIWKRALANCSTKYNSLTDFLTYLQKNGLSITREMTLKNWINIKSDVKFPQRIKDLKVIRKICNSNELNENFEKILSARRLYNGIMIALGRDLSDEISEFIKSKKKGNILERFTEEQINEMINQNAPLKTVKTIKLSNDEQ